MHVLSLVLVVLSDSRLKRGVFVALAAYIWLSRAVPTVHGVVRSIVTIFAVLLRCAVLPRRWAFVRFLFALFTVIFFSSSCTSHFGALSPATLLWCAIHYGSISPTPVLAFAVLILLS